MMEMKDRVELCRIGPMLPGGYVVFNPHLCTVEIMIPCFSRGYRPWNIRYRCEAYREHAAYAYIGIGQSPDSVEPPIHAFLI